jgi:hypothetical protein
MTQGSYPTAVFPPDAFRLKAIRTARLLGVILLIFGVICALALMAIYSTASRAPQPFLLVLLGGVSAYYFVTGLLLFVFASSFKSGKRSGGVGMLVVGITNAVIVGGGLLMQLYQNATAQTEDGPSVLPLLISLGVLSVTVLLIIQASKALKRFHEESLVQPASYGFQPVMPPPLAPDQPYAGHVLAPDDDTRA